MFTNPVIISVLVMIVLCLLKLNVLLSLLVAAMIGGIFGGMTMGETMNILVGGMAGNANTALSYVLLGSLAVAIEMTGASDILSNKIGKLCKNNKYVLALLIMLISMASGTIIPVHIAFIPILIPALLGTMNEMKMDRRMASLSFGFGLKAPYITLPVAYGAIFHGLIKDSMGKAGLEITGLDVVKTNWIIGLTLLLGLIAGWIYYSQPREYENKKLIEVKEREDNVIKKEHIFSLIAGLITLGVQLYTDSLPLGALFGLGVMIISGSIPWDKIDHILESGIGMMGLIAFIMLVASGYADVIIATGGIETLVNSAVSLLGGSKILGSLLMIVIGLLITLGIGTSFGTVPILSTIYVPLAMQLGFNKYSTIFLITAAATIGDTGSPASDTTLGPTSGLNADGQHDHIWDTCVPQFIFYNIPLLIAGVIVPLILG